MIRTTDTSVYTNGATISEKKISDLKHRVEMVNETADALLLSIHKTNFPICRYSGAQVFFAPTQGEPEPGRANPGPLDFLLKPGEQAGMQAGRICIFDAAYPLHRNFGGMRLPLQSRGGSSTADAGIPEKAVLRHCKRGGSVLEPKREIWYNGHILKMILWGGIIRRSMQVNFKQLRRPSIGRRSRQRWQRQRRFFTARPVETRRQNGRAVALPAARGIPWPSIRKKPAAAGKARPVSLLDGTRKPKTLSEVDIQTEIRFLRALGELDRVLGGGAVEGSLVLVGGAPGIGKSTLLLQICACLCRERRVLYASGEESERQLKLRAQRLKVDSENLLILSETRLGDILEAVESKPDVFIADSIQTLYSESNDSAPGSISQVKRLHHVHDAAGKKEGITVLSLATSIRRAPLLAPRFWSIWWTVSLYFEGDQNGTYRLLRAVKTALDLPMRLACLKWGKRACGRCRIHRKCFWQGGPSMRRGPALLVSWKVRDHCWPRFRHWSPKRPSMSPGGLPTALILTGLCYFWPFWKSGGGLRLGTF